MRHSTTDTYQLKREILKHADRISEDTRKDWRKFTGDMIYGVLASGSCVLSRLTDMLQEIIHKKNTVERLSRKLTEDIPERIDTKYLSLMKDIALKDSPVFVDDTDVIKPYGRAFEAMGFVRDGSAPTLTIQKGYQVTEITALSARTKQPFSLFSRIHSSHEEHYTSANEITFCALEKAFPLFPDSTYVFDRSYDMNRLFNFMYQHNKLYLVRLKDQRKLFFKGEWYKATTLMRAHKGKLKCEVMFRGKREECWNSCINVSITASHRPLKLLLVYGLTSTPMMLATNCPIRGKEDAISAVKLYFMLWRIEEYFRFKKQHLGFEGFRVRSLKGMNALNRYLSYEIGLLCLLAEKRACSALRMAVMCAAKALRKEKDVRFLLYRRGLGVCRVLAHAREGIRAWFHIWRPRFRQLSFLMLC